MGVWQTVTAGSALCSVMLAGCAGLGDERRGSQIEIHGEVFSEHRVDLPCPEQAADESRPQELSGIELSFSNAEGDHLGTATTGPLEVEPLDYGCRFYAEYRVTISPAARYRVEFDPPPPRDVSGGYFEGAELLEAREISHGDLEAAGFRWSFEAEPAYVVP